jgi:glutaredoxin
MHRIKDRQDRQDRRDGGMDGEALERPDAPVTHKAGNTGIRSEYSEYMVTLVIQDHCLYCSDAKAVLERLMSEGVDVSLLEVPAESPEGRRIIEQAAAPFMPVVLVNGLPFSYGRLSEKRLRKFLERPTI